MEAVARRTAVAEPAGFAHLLGRTSYYVAATPAQRDEIFRLRYRAYVGEGAYPPSESGIITDALDGAAHARLVGVRVDGELVASLRLVVISAEHPESSATVLFPEVIEPLLAAGKVLVDPNRFVADPARLRKDPRLPFVVARLGFMAVQRFGADIGLATPRSEHFAFYRRVFALERMAAPRLGWGLLKPVGLMGQTREATLAHVRRRYPFVEATDEELDDLFGG